MNRWSILGSHGAVVAPLKFASPGYPGEGLVASSFGKVKVERCGYVDGDGKLHINPQFITCRCLNEGLAAVVFDRASLLNPALRSFRRNLMKPGAFVLVARPFALAGDTTSNG